MALGRSSRDGIWQLDLLFAEQGPDPVLLNGRSDFIVRLTESMHDRSIFFYLQRTACVSSIYVLSAVFKVGSKLHSSLFA